MNYKVCVQSVLFPLIRAVDAPEEYGHGFVGRADLYLHKVGFLVPALLATFLNSRLLGSNECIFTSQNIIDLFPIQLHLVLEGLLDDEYVGARLAIEAEVCRRLLYQQQIRACRTK